MPLSEESNALDSFCNAKLEIILKKRKTLGADNGTSSSASNIQNPGKNYDPDSDMILPILRKVEMDNFKRCTKRMVSTPLHDPNSCMKCQKLEGDIIRKDYLQKNIRKLQKARIDQKIEEHLIKYNTVSVIGNIASDLPKPTMPSNLVWERLFAPLSDKK